MLYRLIFYLLSFSVVIFSSHAAQATTYAWLFDLQSSASKLDVANNKIIQKQHLKGDPRVSVSLQEVDDAIVADSRSNLLLMINDYGRVGQWIGAYNLNDLNFRKDFGIESRDPSFKLPKIVLPTAGNKFYLLWWDSSKEVDGKGGETIGIYEKIALDKISDLASFPIDLTKPWRISSDGEKLYSISIDAGEIKIYDSSSFALLESISIGDLWGTPLFGKGMEHFINENALFVENRKSNEADSNNYMYFRFNIATKTTSNKINVKEAGTGILSPDGNKLIIIEYPRSNSRIHIYDFLTEQKIKTIDLSNKYKRIGPLRISCTSPDGSKLYILGENIQAGVTDLIIIDLKSAFNVIAEIPGVEDSRMIFF